MSTNERQWLENECNSRLSSLQKRIEPLTLNGQAKDLHERVRTILQRACRAEMLRTSHYAVAKLLRPIEESARSGQITYTFSCGPEKVSGMPTPDPKRYLVRDDNAVLSFTVTTSLSIKTNQLKLVAYRFDIRFSNSQPEFVRFDLDERHAKEGLRAHLHPGHEDVRLPGVILCPDEALLCMLVHMRRS